MATDHPWAPVHTVRSTPVEWHPVGTFQLGGGENDAALASHPSVLGMVLKVASESHLPCRETPRQWRK